MNYQQEVIEHLSKEIVANTEQIMIFRARVAFTPWIGPFVVVGAYLVATKDTPKSPHWDTLGCGLLAVAAFLFVGLGWVLAEVERHTWDQCNKWRSLIARIHAGLEKPLDPEDLHFEHHVRLGYSLAAILILSIFFLVIFAASRFLW
jgi:cytochrome bd-type quinol oxidase subunit 1